MTSHCLIESGPSNVPVGYQSRNGKILASMMMITFVTAAAHTYLILKDWSASMYRLGSRRDTIRAGILSVQILICIFSIPGCRVADVPLTSATAAALLVRSVGDPHNLDHPMFLHVDFRIADSGYAFRCSCPPHVLTSPHIFALAAFFPTKRWIQSCTRILVSAVAQRYRSLTMTTSSVLPTKKSLHRPSL